MKMLLVGGSVNREIQKVFRFENVYKVVSIYKGPLKVLLSMEGILKVFRYLRLMKSFLSTEDV